MTWETLVDRYGDRVLLICRSILRDDGLSRDAAQDAMVKLSKANGLSSGAPPQGAKEDEIKDMDAWVATVAGNTARDYIRRAKHRPEPLVEDRMDTGTKSPIESLLAQESQERLRLALEGLPAGDRDILLLRFREGLSGPDIAKALGLTLQAAWQRVSRALKSLKTKMGVDHE